MNDQNWSERSLKAVWHPCTQMKSHEDLPLLAIKNGRGAYLFDYAGKSYLDAISSWWTNLFGHSNPNINQALKNQIDELEHVMLAGMTHRPVVELSERLCTLTQQQLGHAFYGSDGASAVEIALKMGFHYWKNIGVSGKDRFICLQNSYHGETLGALGVTDISLFSQTYSALIKHAILVNSPVPKTFEEDAELASQLAIEHLLHTLENHHHEIACMVIEPMVQCAAGMQMYSPTYLKAARKLCTRYRVLLIADEIAVGFGRTGKFFACEHANIWPDLMTLSKGLTGGYLPLSVVLCRDFIYHAFYQDQTHLGFLHSHSYTGNPLACTAAIATLDVFESTQALKGIAQLSQEIQSVFAWVTKDLRLMNLRQLGTILAFDLQPDAVQAFTDKHPKTSFAKLFFQLALENGLLIRPIGHTVYIMPPYILGSTDLKRLSEKVEWTLDQCFEEDRKMKTLEQS